MACEPKQDHLFISYAGEDKALAKWLTLKLTAEGYRVWCDEVKLLGGESYPRDIDDAIKNRTFRLVAMLSKHSIHKPNPTAERTLALNIARERDVDFLIPLNVDGLKATELDWMTSPLTFIPFDLGWAEGLRHLLKKLASIDAPRTLPNGQAIAARANLPDDVVLRKAETVYSNCLQFLRIPEALRRFELNRFLTDEEVNTLATSWVFYRVTPCRFLAFWEPPALPSGVIITSRSRTSWKDVADMDGVPTANIISSLLSKCLFYHCHGMGLEVTADRKRLLYFPQSLLEGNRLSFTHCDGTKTWLLTAGERAIRKANGEIQHYRYHLAFKFKVLREILEHRVARLGVALYMTDASGSPLADRSANARRKRVTRDWWNDEWLKRHVAICHYLAHGQREIAIGAPSKDLVVVSAEFDRFEAPLSINEDALGKPEERPDGPHGVPGEEDQVEEEGNGDAGDADNPA